MLAATRHADRIHSTPKRNMKSYDIAKCCQNGFQIQEEQGILRRRKPSLSQPLYVSNSSSSTATKPQAPFHYRLSSPLRRHVSFLSTRSRQVQAYAQSHHFCFQSMYSLERNSICKQSFTIVFILYLL